MRQWIKGVCVGLRNRDQIEWLELDRVGCREVVGGCVGGFVREEETGTRC